MEKKLHAQVWNRFVRMPYGHIVDSADLEGNAVIPTAEECRNYIPSILAWSTPIANGAMFGGLYLYALCEKYGALQEVSLKEEIATLVKGLLLLCDISEVDGFIARGVADDGVTHYPCSSNDQTGPWILGLWKAMHSDATDADMKGEIRKRLDRALRGFYQNDWSFRNEWEGTALGTFKSGDYRNCAKFLFAAAVAKELGIVSSEEFSAYAEEIPAKGLYSRREILSKGFVHEMLSNSVLKQFWITVCAHLSQRELCALDPNGAAQYEQGIALNCYTSKFFVREFDRYAPDDFSPYDHDWRRIVPDLKRGQTYEEILSEGRRANDLYGANVCPLRYHERETLGQALFAAWIAVVGDDRAVAEYAYAALCECIEKVDWDRVGQCYAFVAESVLITYAVRHSKNQREKSE